LSRGKAPPEFRELVDPIFGAADNGGTVGRPDVVARLEVWDRVRPFDGDAGRRERCQIVGAIDVIPIVVAHVKTSAVVVSV
jgi:hypothetical protein